MVRLMAQKKDDVVMHCQQYYFIVYMHSILQQGFTIELVAYL